MPKCNKCGQINPVGASFCTRCGAMIFAPSFPDTETNEVIEAARDAINDPLASYESKRRAILTVKEYAREGHQKARIILLNYSRLVTGNPRLQKLASDP